MVLDELLDEPLKEILESVSSRMNEENEEVIELAQRQRNVARNVAKMRAAIPNQTMDDPVALAAPYNNEIALAAQGEEMKKIVLISSALFRTARDPEPELSSMMLCPAIAQKFDDKELRAIQRLDKNVFMALAKFADHHHATRYNQLTAGMFKERARAVADDLPRPHEFIKAHELLIKAGLKTSWDGPDTYGLNKINAAKEAKEKEELKKLEVNSTLSFDYKQIAQLSGISYSHVLNVLTGKSQPSLNVAMVISSAMNLTLEEFYSLIKSLTPNKYSGGRDLEQVEINLILSDKGKMTTRKAALKYHVSRETISRIWKSS